jgi:hypothetical protein
VVVGRPEVQDLPPAVQALLREATMADSVIYGRVKGMALQLQLKVRLCYRLCCRLCHRLLSRESASD